EGGGEGGRGRPGQADLVREPDERLGALGTIACAAWTAGPALARLEPECRAHERLEREPAGDEQIHAHDELPIETEQHGEARARADREQADQKRPERRHAAATLRSSRTAARAAIASSFIARSIR